MFSYLIINKSYITIFYAMFNQAAVLEQKVKRKEHYEFQQM